MLVLNPCFTPGLQQQYKECQELLGLYQQYLSQQQAKLNESIAQLTQPAAHRKVRYVHNPTGTTFKNICVLYRLGTTTASNKYRMSTTTRPHVQSDNAQQTLKVHLSLWFDRTTTQWKVSQGDTSEAKTPLWVQPL